MPTFSVPSNGEQTAAVTGSTQPRIVIDGDRFVAEWDNRQLAAGDRITAVLLAGFWIVWTPATIAAAVAWVYGLFGLLAGEADAWKAVAFFSVWLVFGVMGVVAISPLLLMRWSPERVEIDSREYRHTYTRFPWLYPRAWKVSQITSVDCRSTKQSFDVRRGQLEDVQHATWMLYVRKGRRRDSVAYWTSTDFKRELARAMRAHLRRVGGLNV